MTTHSAAREQSTSLSPDWSTPFTIAPKWQSKPGPRSPAAPTIFSADVIPAPRERRDRRMCMMSPQPRVQTLLLADSHGPHKSRCPCKYHAFIAVRTHLGADLSSCRRTSTPTREVRKGEAIEVRAPASPGGGRGPHSGQYQRVSRTPLGQLHAAVTIQALHHTVLTVHTTGSSHERVVGCREGGG